MAPTASFTPAHFLRITREGGDTMAKDRENQGGPTDNPNDENDPSKNQRDAGNSAQSQSGPEGDDERRNREGAGESRRSGSQSNPS